MPHDAQAEQLELYALGLLDEEENRQLEAHLAECAECRGEVRELVETGVALARTAPPLAPRPELRDRVLALTSPQVWKQWLAESPADLHVVREGEGEWQRVSEGIYAKQLYVDRSRDLVTMLVRMEPGSKYVPHRHAAPEQCFVLEGDIRDGEDVFRAGDFQVLAPGSVHGAQWTESGCLVLIFSSLEDELLV
jgi:anti-sigma factor ChrR (cupin superfamily)